jgi:DUF971 family protein
MSGGASQPPTRLARLPNGELAVAWPDGHESYYPPRALRCACGCAHCVDEQTGQKLLDDSRVPADVRLEQFHAVGRYGISIHWSDGHGTGIYTFSRLRQLCPCGKC